MKYQLFKDGVPVSKPHSTIEAVLVEAYEMGAVLRVDGKNVLANGYAVHKFDGCETADALMGVFGFKRVETSATKSAK